MSKVSLKDMKSHNRRLILQSIINGQSLSRIALARETGLAPSTVTSLVAELMDEGVLAESGLTLSTGGRGRKELKVNSGYGLIAIIEISRRKTHLCIYDMSLKKLEEKPVAERRLSGNNLFFEISTAIIDCFYQKDDGLRLAGIGLLFQEDMIESDLTVMFSTSLSSDNIPLKEALYTQFKVPVAGEYSVSEVLNTIEAAEAKNSVHIALANTALISLTIDGRPIQMSGGKSANITRLLSFFQPVAEPEEKAVQGRSVFSRVAGILALLCGMFSLDIILLSGEAVKARGFVSAVRETLAMILSPAAPPPIRVLQSPGGRLNEKMAMRVRSLILGAA